MDGVLADFDGQIANIWQKMYPNIPFIDIKTRKTFYLAHSMPQEYQNMIEEIYLKKGFFLSLPKVLGGKEALEYMIKQGHTVAICTAPLIEYHNCVSEKLAWIEKNLGKKFISKTIITRDKTLARGDVLIDDKPNIKGALVPAWEHIVFDNNRAYNQGQNKRYLNWQNFRLILGI